MSVSISSRFAGWALGLLFGVALGLALVSFVTQAYGYLPYRGFPFEVISSFDDADRGFPWLNVDGEGTIPAWFSSSVLLLCSVLLTSLSIDRKGGEGYALHWQALAVIFLLFSIDEAAALHERTSQPLRSALNAGGFLYYTWVILGAAFVLIFALTYLRFLFALPSRTRRLCIVAGLLFVCGALGMEMIDGRYADMYGTKNVTYVSLTTIEELLEMLGGIVFLYALMLHTGSGTTDAKRHGGTVT
jgi:hypothetical protein